VRVPSRAEEGGEFPWFVRKEVVVGVRFVQMAPPRGDRKRASGARASQIAEGIADVCGAGGVDAEPMTGKKDAVCAGFTLSISSLPTNACMCCAIPAWAS
jgi:hypothetical protein